MKKKKYSALAVGLAAALLSSSVFASQKCVQTVTVEMNDPYLAMKVNEMGGALIADGTLEGLDPNLSFTMTSTSHGCHADANSQNMDVSLTSQSPTPPDSTPQEGDEKQYKQRRDGYEYHYQYKYKNGSWELYAWSKTPIDEHIIPTPPDDGDN